MMGAGMMGGAGMMTPELSEQMGALHDQMVASGACEAQLQQHDGQHCRQS